MSDALANDLQEAVAKLANPRDKRFGQSLLDQHRSGKPLSANQMYWAKTLIERSGKQAPSTAFADVSEDIFDEDANKVELSRKELAKALAEARGSAYIRTPIMPSAHVMNLIQQDKIIEAIKSHRSECLLSLVEAESDVVGARDALRQAGQTTDNGWHNGVKKEGVVTTNSDVDKLNALNEAKLQNIIERVLGSVKADLTEQNDRRESNLSARQESFNKNASKAIAAACVEEAIKRLDARVPRQVVITVKQPDGTTTTQEGPQHPMFEELLRAATVRKDDSYVPGIFVAGERGSGKTTGCRLAAKAMGLTWYANGAIGMAHEMLGFVDGAGKYHRTPFREAFEHGGWFTFDEVDRSDPGALLAVNPHLANNEASFPDGMVRRHKDCIITATGNTWGYGASLEFSGACKLDEAFLSRFEIKLPWDVDKAFERKLVANAAWMDYVERARAKVREAGIKYTIDSRAAMAGARMISQLGYTFEKAAEQTYLASLKPDQKKIVQGLNS